MKEMIVIMFAFALLLFGCTGISTAPAQQQNTSEVPPAPPSSSGNVPPAPPSGNLGVPPAPPEGNGNPLSNGSNVSPPPPASGVSASQLAAHNSVSDCWVAYKGKVYDITQFIPNHKNGEMLIGPLCGTAGNFQEMFNNKHGTSKEAILMQQAFVGNYAG